MDTFDAVAARRACKSFDAAHRMRDDERDRLLRTALHSPSAFNLQPWRMVLLDDAGLRREVRAIAWDQSQVTDASLVIVLCADLQAWAREPTRYWRHAPSAARAMIVPSIDRFYRAEPQRQRDEAMRACGIFAQTLMLCAKAMRYDSCPMIGFDVDALASLIHLPDDHVITMMLAIGRAIAPPWTRGGQLTLDEVVVRNRF